MGRIWRIGQTRPVSIYRLVMCGSIEENILMRQMNKEQISDSVIDRKKKVCQIFDAKALK